MLHEYFHTKAQMANALGVQLRTLRYNFKNLDRSKGASALALLEAALHLTGTPRTELRREGRAAIRMFVESPRCLIRAATQKQREA